MNQVLAFLRTINRPVSGLDICRECGIAGEAWPALRSELMRHPCVSVEGSTRARTYAWRPEGGHTAATAMAPTPVPALPPEILERLTRLEALHAKTAEVVASGVARVEKAVAEMPKAIVDELDRREWTVAAPTAVRRTKRALASEVGGE